MMLSWREAATIGSGHNFGVAPLRLVELHSNLGGDAEKAKERLFNHHPEIGEMFEGFEEAKADEWFKANSFMENCAIPVF